MNMTSSLDSVPCILSPPIRFVVCPRKVAVTPCQTIVVDSWDDLRDRVRACSTHEGRQPESSQLSHTFNIYIWIIIF